MNSAPVYAAASLLLGALLGATAMWFYARTRQDAMQAKSQAENAANYAAMRAERDILQTQLQAAQSLAHQQATHDQALSPLQNGLIELTQTVQQLEGQRRQDLGRLDAHLRTIAGNAAALEQETARLAGALHSSAVRGNWGEMQLRWVFELAGMLEHVDFSVQVSAENDAGIVRPDVVVRLPQNRHFVVDAKAPLSAFLAAQDQDKPEQARSEALREHASALATHARALAKKQYWAALPNTPEFVICFVPSDAMLSAAINAQTVLVEQLMQKNVVLTSPSTLLAMLRTAALAWQQDQVTANATQLVKLGQELHSRIGVVGRHAHDLGSSLRRSVDSYNRFIGSLESRVLVTARKITEMGVTTGSETPALTPVDSSPRATTHPEIVPSAASEDLTGN